MNVQFNEITAEFYLPCGHALRFVYQVRLAAKPDDYHRQPENYPHQLYDGIQKLDAMLAGRSERHQCELVSEDNPHGLPRSS